MRFLPLLFLLACKDRPSIPPAAAAVPGPADARVMDTLPVPDMRPVDAGVLPDVGPLPDSGRTGDAPGPL